MPKKTKLSTEPYKGVRDFYPEDMYVLNYVFTVIRDTVESFGYEEHTASPLEYSEIYAAKSGDEIAREQAYRLTDQGGRDITLRPEMTPTTARMVAARSRTLAFPVRWYSVPNVFRYESPQRGRLREHYQLNADFFGGNADEADTEMIVLINAIMTSLGARPEDFVIKINDRALLNDLYEALSIPEDVRHPVSKILDKKDKISEADFTKALSEHLDDERVTNLIEALKDPKTALTTLKEDNPNRVRMLDRVEDLTQAGISNIVFEPTLIRGFDYYTGFVFEVFDVDPKNRRSLFGGGRYDSLLSLFGDKDIPAVGFGMGDVTLMDFLETHNLLPEYRPLTHITFCHTEVSYMAVSKFAQRFRESGFAVDIDTSGKKLGDQIKRALKRGVPLVAIVGEHEIESNTLTLKHLETKDERSLSFEDAVSWIHDHLTR